MNRDDDITTIRVFLVDDHALLREGIAALLADEADIEIVGQCGDGIQAAQEVEQVKPDVVVLDITLPQLNGLEVCRRICRKLRNTAVLILTMHADEEYIVGALKAGASGYLLKEAASEQLTRAVRAIAGGELFLGSGIPHRVLQRLTEDTDDDPYSSLTDRERQVLQLIAEGQTNRQIADKLGVSVKTVDTHRTRLMRKLGIHDQTTLVKFAIRKGIVTVM